MATDGTGSPDWLDDVRLQLAGVGVTLLLVASWHWANDGLWFQGDAPRHAMTGLFLWDLLTTWPADPLDYALRYYARYPALVLGVYPPLFHAVEGVAFGMAGATPWAARTVVLLAAGGLAVYTLLWGRRWVSPTAGWAGAAVVLVPGVVRYSNVVLLNIPATALCLGALFHLRVRLDGGPRRHGWLAAVFFVAAAMTYYPAAIVVPMAASWLVVPGARNRLRLLWIPLAAVLVVLAGLSVALPGLFARHAPSFAKLVSPIGWTYYAAHTVSLLGPVWPWLAAGGLLLGAVLPARRRDATHVALAVASAVVALALLPARDERYALILAPLAVLAGFALTTDVLARIAARPAVRALAVAILLAIGVRTAAATPVPRLTGIDAVARFLADRSPRGAVLYSGIYDGVFAFYVRAFDPHFERRVVFANRLLYQWRQANDFRWHETPQVRAASDVAPLIAGTAGCEWVAVEVGGEFQLPETEHVLRDALAGPGFERVASFPVPGKPVSRVDVYRVTVPVAATPQPVRLDFPSFSGRVFPGVEPIPSRP